MLETHPAARDETLMAAAKKTTLLWGASFGTEGAPVFLAEIDTYLGWGGAGRTPEPAQRLHWYGPLVAKLPPELQPDGVGSWHQWTETRTEDEARAIVEQLRAAVARLAPNAKPRTQVAMTPEEVLATARGGATEEWLTKWRDTIERGIDFEDGEERVLHVDVRIATDFDRACHELRERDAALLDVRGSPAVFWSIHGGGGVEVGLSRRGARPEIVLVRSWLDEDRDKKKVREHVQKPELAEDEVGSIAFSSGALVALDGAYPPEDLVRDEGDPRQALHGAASLRPPIKLNTAAILSVGTVLRTAPGTYRVATGSHEDEGWSCRWCRLLGADVS